MNICERTDIALECIDESAGILPKGIERKIRKSSVCDITEIIVNSTEGAKKLGKSMGKYITIETDRLSSHPKDFKEQTENISDEIQGIVKNPERILIVGLGNRNITPDALGPLTADRIIATKHLSEIPEVNFLTQVSVLSPGVTGQTGIEVQEIISSVCEKINPTAIIAIDALACAELSRLGTTIQLTDTGISPGSGVLNKRKELSKSTLGVDTYAIGIPTVTDLYNIFSEKEKNFPNMMITPRDIDELIRRAASLLSLSINKAFQKNLSDSEIISLM